MKILAILCLLAGVAIADDKVAAEKYFRAGAKAYAAQNFEAAIASFEEAYRALPAPEIAFSAAQAYRRQYRVDPKPEYVKRSVELYRAYLDRVKTGGRVGDAADSLGEMQRELDRLAATGVHVTEVKLVERTRIGVTIELGTEAAAAAMREIGDGGTGDALPAGTRATLDGKPLEPFALVDVEVGDHALAVSAPGYQPVTKHYRAVAGASELVDMPLVAQPAKVAIATEAGTHVMVDGRAQGTMPMGALELVAGKHVVALLRSGRKPVARELALARGEELKLDVPLERSLQRRAVIWTSAGAAVLALGTATALAVALVADHDARSTRDGIMAGDRPAADADMYDAQVARRDTARTATYVLGGATLLTALVATGLYVFDSPDVTVTPTGIAGRF